MSDLKTEFQKYPNLASAETGSSILFATDDFFAVAENLLKKEEPKFDINTYTEFGKEMDGWETRRKRIPGHDWGLPGQIIGFEVNTAFFTGNYVPSISIQGTHESEPVQLKRRSEMGSMATEAELAEATKLNSHNWTTILPQTNLKSGVEATRYHYFPIKDSQKYNNLRLNLFPDGGIARLRVYGLVKPDFTLIKSPCDLAVVTNGGRAIQWTNSHYGVPMQLLMPKRSTGMHDGWETARNIQRPSIYKLDKDGLLNFVGKESCVIQLGRSCKIEKVVVDTNHYKGNFPESCMVEWTSDESIDQTQWNILLDRVKLKPHCLQEFAITKVNQDARFVKLTMIPDGGISRFRVFGSFIDKKRPRAD